MVGVDIGHGSLKLVYTKNGNVKGYGLYKLPPFTISNGRIIDPVSFVNVLSRGIKELSLKGQRAAVVLPNSAVFFRKVSLPIMEESEVEAVLERSINEHVSFSPEDIYWDFYIHGINPADERYMEVVLAVSKRDQVDYVVSLFAASGLNVCIVDGFPFSCYNGIEHLLKGTNRFVLLDVGFFTTKFFIYEGPYPVVSREFPTDISVRGDDELKWAKAIVAQVLKISKTVFTNPMKDEIQKGFVVGGCFSEVLLEGLREVLEVDFRIPEIKGIDLPELYVASYGASLREEVH